MDKKITDRFLLFQRNSMKIDKLKDEEISKVKLEMLNKLVECEENKLHSKIHPIYCHYFPEWVLTSKKLIKTIYKRILKSEPSMFLNFSNADSMQILAGQAEKLRNNIKDYVKINIDYDCIKNICFVLLNCMHYLKWKKKSFSGFLKKETLNTISKEVTAIFMELESIKSIKIILFDIVVHKESSLKTSTIECDSKMKYLSISNESKSFNNFSKSKSYKEIMINNSEISYDYVYIFHLLLGFIFPNQLEIELCFDLDGILNKYRNADGMLKDHKKVCKKYEKYFVVLLLTTYFISKNEKIQKLKLDVNESNLLETYYLIQSCPQIKHDLKLEFKIKEFTFLDNFDRSTNFYGLELTFNCLDDILFNKLSNITFKNFGLRSLNITFFPKESNNYYQKQGLNKILKVKKAFINMDNFVSETFEENHNQSNSVLNFDLFNSNNKSKVMYFNNGIDDDELQNEECDDIFDKIYDKFDENMKNLFIVIESKINILRNLIITLNPPNNILDEICYVSSFTVFFYNLLKLLGKENSEISQIELNSEHIPLNFQLLGQNNCKDIGINLKKAKIENFIFNIKIENYYNVTRFIPESIVCLKLSSLTYETLTVLVSKLKKRFHLYKNLIELSLNVYLSNKDLGSLSNTTKEFFKLNKPKNIEILSFRMQYVLKTKDVDDILDIIHNEDNVHQYHDKILNYELKFSCQGRIDINKHFCKLDEKYLSRIIALVYCFNKSKLIRCAHIERIKKTVSLYLYSYTKNVKLF